MPQPCGPSITSAQSRARSPHIAACLAAELSCVFVVSVIDELASIARGEGRKVLYVPRFLGTGRKSPVRRRHAYFAYEAFESRGRDDEEHPAAVGADAIAVRHIAWAERVVVRRRDDRRAADVEGHLSLQHPKPLVLVVM